MADAALDIIFKAYDVRGVYPDELDESIARRVGNALVAFTGAARILVGHDARPSSEPLVAAFREGATIAGADVARPRARLHGSLLLRLRRSRRARGDDHRQPQPARVQRHQALPSTRRADR